MINEDSTRIHGGTHEKPIDRLGKGLSVQLDSPH